MNVTGQLGGPGHGIPGQFNILVQRGNLLLDVLHGAIALVGMTVGVAGSGGSLLGIAGDFGRGGAHFPHGLDHVFTFVGLAFGTGTDL